MPGSTFTSLDPDAPRSVENKHESPLILLSNCLKWTLFSAITELKKKMFIFSRALKCQLNIVILCYPKCHQTSHYLWTNGKRVRTAGKEDAHPQQPQPSRSERCRHLSLSLSFSPVYILCCLDYFPSFHTWERFHTLLSILTMHRCQQWIDTPFKRRGTELWDQVE